MLSVSEGKRRGIGRRKQERDGTKKEIDESKKRETKEMRKEETKGGSSEMESFDGDGDGRPNEALMMFEAEKNLR